MYPFEVHINLRTLEGKLVRTLFLESFPRDSQLRLSWSARSTLSSKKFEHSGFSPQYSAGSADCGRLCAEC
jgi:hypothetical protein